MTNVEGTPQYQEETIQEHNKYTYLNSFISGSYGGHRPHMTNSLESLAYTFQYVSSKCFIWEQHLIKYDVAIRNNLEKFSIEHCWIKVTVTVGYGKFYVFTTIQTVRSHNSTLVGSRQNLSSMTIFIYVDTCTYCSDQNVFLQLGRK